MRVSNQQPQSVMPRQLAAWQVPLVYFAFYSACVFINAQINPGASVSIEAVSLGILFSGLLIASAWISNPRVRPVTYIASTKERTIIAWTLRVVPTLAATLIAVRWIIMVREYHSLVAIFAHAFAIRMSEIGHNGPPSQVLSGYVISLLFAAFALAISIWLSHPSRTILMYALLCATLILSESLLTFGRMELLWVLLLCASTFLLFRIETVLRSKQLAFVIVVGLLVAELPHTFRHGGLTSDLFGSRLGEGYSSSAAVWLTVRDGVDDTFTDYSSGLSAFSTFLDRDTKQTWGLRTFTPVFRLTARLGLIHPAKYITTIDRPATNISPDYNIYTVLRDFDQDFGPIGVALLGIVIGACYGKIFGTVGLTANAITIYVTTWVLYTPFYNAFSFGAFLIPFLFLGALHLFTGNVAVRYPMEARNEA